MADLTIAADSTTALAAADAGKEVATEKTVESKPDQAALDAKALAEKTAADLAAKPFTDTAQLKLPDGMKLDEGAMKEFLPLAGKLGLTAAQAQALVEFNAKSGGTAEAARTAARDATAAKVAESLKSDRDIGGAQFDASMKLAGKALAYIGSPELTAALQSARLEDGSMLGDQPWFAKILVNLGKKVAEDTTGNTHSNGTKTPANDAGSLQRALYTNPTSKSLKFD